MDIESYNSQTALFFGLLVAWSIVWKGMALWKAARRDDTAWFVVFLVLNTLGVLEIIYVFFVGRKQKKSAGVVVTY